MSSFLVSLNNRFIAKHYLSVIRPELEERAESKDKGKLTVEDVIDVLRKSEAVHSHPVLKRVTPSDPKKLRELSSNIIVALNYDVRKEADDPDQHWTDVSKHAVFTLVSFTKYCLNNLYPLLQSSLEGTPQEFSREFKDLLAVPQVPHEKLLHEIVGKLQESVPEFIKAKFLQDLREIIDRPLPDDINGAEALNEWTKQWLNELEEVFSNLILELPDEVKPFFQEKFKALIQKEVAELMKEGVIAPPRSSNPQQMLHSVLSNIDDPELVAQIQRQFNSSGMLSPLLQMMSPEGESLPLFQGQQPTGRDSKTPQNAPGWNNGYGQWIMGLGSAAVTLGSYLFKEEKTKGLLFGLGTFGLGGVLASAFSPIRNIFGINGKPGPTLAGWGDGVGKWIVGAGSAVLSLLGYYISDEKLKTSLFGLGTFGLGGVLASSSSRVRSLFGVETLPNGLIDLLQSLGIEPTAFQRIAEPGTQRRAK